MLLKCICGLLQVSEGTIIVQDKVVGKEVDFPENIGFIIETPGFLPNDSGFKNLKYLASIKRKIDDEAIRTYMDLVGLDRDDKKRVGKYSLGMRQRLGIALALVGSPDLLLLDEPFNGIDPEETRALRSALMRLNHERGVTMVISSHVLDQLNRMATRFGVIRSGRMVREFSEEALHAACGSSVRVKTTDPARSLAILEEHLPGAAFRVEPDGGIVITGAAGARHAAASFGGAASDAAATGAPAAEDVSRALATAGQTIIELSVLERDFEEYFVELMGADAEPSSTHAESRR